MKAKSATLQHVSGLKEQNINEVWLPADDPPVISMAMLCGCTFAYTLQGPHWCFCASNFTLIPSLNASLYQACSSHCNMLQGLVIFSELGTSCFSHCAPATWNNMQNNKKLMLFLFLELFKSLTITFVFVDVPALVYSFTLNFNEFHLLLNVSFI